MSYKPITIKASQEVDNFIKGHHLIMTAAGESYCFDTNVYRYVSPGIYEIVDKKDVPRNVKITILEELI